MVPPALRSLLEENLFDWDNPRHREAYLRAWVKGEFPPEGKEEEADGRALAAGHHPLTGQA